MPVCRTERPFLFKDVPSLAYVNEVDRVPSDEFQRNWKRRILIVWRGLDRAVGQERKKARRCIIAKPWRADYGNKEDGFPDPEGNR